MKRAALALVLLAACANRYDPKKDPTLNPDLEVPSVKDIPGLQCSASSDLMRVVDKIDGTTFCIDVFEASLDGGAQGNAQQAADDTSDSTDGSTTAKATVGLHVEPASGVSYYQAKAACENAGKRLCTQVEWERACRGPTALLYPYGDSSDDKACNGFFNYATTNPMVTGSLKTCVSPYGVFDMSGNLSEWTSTPAERVPGSEVFNDRAQRGGGYDGNSVALRCVGEEYRDAPGSAPADRGFRCCL
jgi:formylglycine-generating enzyme required for sulfatase activity